MNKQILIYASSALLSLVGLICVIAAFRKKKVKEKMDNALKRPPLKNYGNPFLWLFGLFCILLAIFLLLNT